MRKSEALARTWMMILFNDEDHAFDESLEPRRPSDLQAIPDELVDSTITRRPHGQLRSVTCDDHLTGLNGVLVSKVLAIRLDHGAVQEQLHLTADRSIALLRS